MSLFRRSPDPTALPLGLLISCLACSSVDRTCSEDSSGEFGGRGERYESSPIRGTVSLPGVTTQTVSFEVVLSHLPVVWLANGTVTEPRVAATVALSYGEDSPEGAELPEVSLLLAHADGSSPPASSLYGGPQEATLGGFTSSSTISIEPFHACEFDGQQDCCTFGSRSCSGSVKFRFSRTDELFPAVDLSWEVRATASVSRCLREQDTPALDLTELK
jgi:hypothetical protein